MTDAPPPPPAPNPPMSPWIVEPSTERVELRDNRAEVTFTVTNPQAVAQRAVFEIAAGDSVDASWFVIEGDRQRPLEPNQSTQFKVAIVAPAGTPVASYWFQARAYAADTAPEESSALSNRVTFAVKQPTDRPRKAFPWWIVAVVAFLVLVGGVVAFLLTRGDGLVVVPDVAGATQAQATTMLTDAGFEEIQVEPVQSAEAPGTALETDPAAGSQADPSGPITLRIAVVFTIPDVSGLPTTEAQATLGEVGFSNVTVVRVHVPQLAGTVIGITPPAGTQVEDLNTAIALRISVSLTAPNLVSPDEGTRLAGRTATLTWDAVPDAARYEVSWTSNCLGFSGFCPSAEINPTDTQPSDTTSFEIDIGGPRAPFGLSYEIAYTWHVTAVDDEGNSGPQSATRSFTWKS